LVPQERKIRAPKCIGLDFGMLETRFHRPFSGGRE